MIQSSFLSIKVDCKCEIKDSFLFEGELGMIELIPFDAVKGKFEIAFKLGNKRFNTNDFVITPYTNETPRLYESYKFQEDETIWFSEMENISEIRLWLKWYKKRKINEFETELPIL
jgi:hypothetical protein